MHIHFLDPYRAGLSPIHRLDPRVKFILTLGFVLTCALTPNGAWATYILLLATILALEILSELGVIFVLKRAVLALPFVLAALPVIFSTEGEPLMGIPLGGLAMGVTQEGVVRFVSIGLKSWISVQAAILLAASTPFPDLLLAMRAVKVPRLLVAVFSLMWRYLFVLADEALRLMRARAARSGLSDRPGLKHGGSLAWRARQAGNMAGSLFVRALERSDRIYVAMLSRGYDGEVRAAPLPALEVSSWLALILGLAGLAFLLVLALLI